MVQAAVAKAITAPKRDPLLTLRVGLTISLTANFLSLILKEFAQHNTIVEKYDVARRESEVAGGIKFGYEYNVIGFGWTNAAVTELYAQLPETQNQTCGGWREYRYQRLKEIVRPE